METTVAEFYDSLADCKFEDVWKRICSDPMMKRQIELNDMLMADSRAQYAKDRLETAARIQQGQSEG